MFKWSLWPITGHLGNKVPPQLTMWMKCLTWLLELPPVSDDAVTKISSSFLLDLSIFFFFPALHQLQKLQLWICDKETARFILGNDLFKWSRVRGRHFAVKSSGPIYKAPTSFHASSPLIGKTFFKPTRVATFHLLFVNSLDCRFCEQTPVIFEPGALALVFDVKGFSETRSRADCAYFSWLQESG